jgi:hypothetical protein
MKLAYHEVNKLRATRNSILRMAVPHLGTTEVGRPGSAKAYSLYSLDFYRRRSASSRVTRRATVIAR